MEFEKTIINVIFDAGKGTVTVSCREATVDSPLGALPLPVRHGYRFAGWQLDGEAVTAETVVTSRTDIRLVAQWEKEKRRKGDSMLKRQKIAVTVLSIVCVLLVAVLLVVNEVVSWKPFNDYYIKDGQRYSERYYVKKTGGTYKVFDKDGKAVRQNEYGYFIVASENQYRLDQETGEITLYAVVDDGTLESTELLGVKGMVLIFPQLEQKNIYSISISGGKNTPYRFYKDASGAVQIEIAGSLTSANVEYDQELFASLCVSTGYTITSKKLDLTSAQSTVPRKEDGSVNYAEFGLENRYDEEGNLIYSPVTYTICDLATNEFGEVIQGNLSYTVIVGDKTLPEGGYYARLEGRDAIYILGSTIEDTALKPIEALVVPRVIYPMSLSSYMSVKNFLLSQVNVQAEDIKTEISEGMIVSFSFLDLLARTNTMNLSRPYINLDLESDTWMEGYDINDEKMSKMLELLSQMEIERCCQLGLGDPQKEDERFLATLKKYNLDGEIWVLYLDSPETDENGTVTGYLENEVWISPKTADGTYYMASFLYDMVVEVDQYYLSFLEWELNAWYYPNFFSENINIMSKLNITVGGKDYNFTLDNQMSYFYYENSEGKMTLVNGKDGRLYSKNGNYEFEDTAGVRHPVKRFDLSKGGIFFKIEETGKTPSYEKYACYRLTLDRNGCKTLEFVREDGSVKKYELSYLASDGKVKDVRSFTVVYRDDKNNEFAVLGKYSTGDDNTVEDSYQVAYWKEVAVKDEEGNTTYQWNRVTFSNVANGVMLMDSDGKIYEIEADTKNLLVYCNQYENGTAHKNLLDYTIVHTEKDDKGGTKTETIPALENFRQLYVNLVTLTVEGDLDEATFIETTGMTSAEYIKTHACDASISFSASDAAKNSNLYTQDVFVQTNEGEKIFEEQYWKANNKKDIIIRFYLCEEFSMRRIMMTVEVVDDITKVDPENPATANAVAKFYVTKDVLDWLQEDLDLLLSEQKIVDIDKHQ